MKRTRLASTILAAALVGGASLLGTAVATPAQASTASGCGGFVTTCDTFVSGCGAFGGFGGFDGFGVAGFGDFGLVGFEGGCLGF